MTERKRENLEVCRIRLGLGNGISENLKKLSRLLVVVAALQAGGCGKHDIKSGGESNLSPGQPRSELANVEQATEMVEQGYEQDAERLMELQSRITDSQLGRLKRELKKIQEFYAGAKLDGNLLRGKNGQVFEIIRYNLPILVLEAYPTPSGQVVGLGVNFDRGNAKWGVFAVQQDGSAFFAPFPPPFDALDLYERGIISRGFGDKFVFEIVQRPSQENLPSDIRIKQSGPNGARGSNLLCFVNVKQGVKVVICLTGTPLEVVLLNNEFYLGKSTSEGIRITSIDELAKNGVLIQETEVDEILNSAWLVRAGDRPRFLGNNVMDLQQALFVDSQQNYFIVSPSSNGFQVRTIGELNPSDGSLFDPVSFTQGLNYIIGNLESLPASAISMPLITAQAPFGSTDSSAVLSANAGNGTSQVAFYNASRLFTIAEISQQNTSARSSRTDQIIRALQKEFAKGITVELGPGGLPEAFNKAFDKVRHAVLKLGKEYELENLEVHGCLHPSPPSEYLAYSVQISFREDGKDQRIQANIMFSTSAGGGKEEVLNVYFNREIPVTSINYKR